LVETIEWEGENLNPIGLQFSLVLGIESCVFTNSSVKLAGYIVGEIECLVNIGVKMLKIEKLNFTGW